MSEVNEPSRESPRGQTESVSTRRRAAGRLDADNLAEEDIDDQEITVNLSSTGRLIDDELLSFVNVYFSNEILAHDAYHTRHATHPEVNRNGSRIVWVENSQTGEMIPIARRAGGRSAGTGARRRGTAGKGGDTEAGDDEDDLLDLEEGGVGGGDTYLNPLHSVPPLPPPLDDSLDPRTGKPLLGAGGVGMSGAGGAVALALQRQEAEIAPIVRYHNLVMVQRATYLVFQCVAYTVNATYLQLFYILLGLMAGFCFTTLFTVEAAGGNDSTLLDFYQPNAGDYRRFFYILATISLVGSIDLCLTVLGSRAESAQTPTQQHQQGHSATYYRALAALRLNYDASAVILALAIALFYAVAFLVTLLMGTFDVLTMVRDGFPETDQWTELALKDTEYSALLEQWKAYNTVRVICSVSAWLGSCLFVWKDLTQLNYKSADLFRLRETTTAWSNRVREMEGGAGLDQLRPTALKKLLAILKVGVDRARDALSFYEQQQDTAGGSGGILAERADVAPTGPVAMEIETESLIPK